MALCYNGPFPPLLMPPTSTKNAQNEEPAARQLTLRAFEKPVALAILTAAITVTMFLRFMTLADRMTHCDDTGFLVNALPASGALEAGNLVAKAWTYGPGQFVLGYPLWASAPTWRQTVFAARIPSGIAEMLGLLLIVWLLSKIGFGLKPGLHSPRTAPFAGLFSAVLALCSLRAMIESQQGYPYAAACAMVALTAALLYQFTAACNELPLSKLPVWTGYWPSLADSLSLLAIRLRFRSPPASSLCGSLRRRSFERRALTRSSLLRELPQVSDCASLV